MLATTRPRPPLRAKVKAKNAETSISAAHILSTRLRAGSLDDEDMSWTDAMSREELILLLSTAQRRIELHKIQLDESSFKVQELKDEKERLRVQLDAVAERLSPDGSFSFSSSSLRRHRRKSSSATLALLTDQNNDLRGRLAQLDADSQEHGAQGRARLRELERQISGLRAELEHSNERNAELEEKLSSSPASSIRQRRRPKSFEQDVSNRPPDFAPPNELSFSSKLKSKLTELSYMDQQIVAAHSETEGRLEDARVESQEIRRALDELADESGIYLEAEESEDGSLRFRTVRQREASSAEGSPQKPKAIGNQQAINSRRNSRARKSITGLFPSDSIEIPSYPVSSTRSRATSFASKFSFPSQRSSISSSEEVGLHSLQSELGDLSKLAHPVPAGLRTRYPSLFGTQILAEIGISSSTTLSSSESQDSNGTQGSRSSALSPMDDFGSTFERENSSLFENLPELLPGQRRRRLAQNSMTSFVLTIWLWLQFAIVVLLFLWTVSKKGPRTLLKQQHR